MDKTRRILFRVAAVAILVAIAAVMMIVGRGHTVYLDNKNMEYEGESYSAPYKVVVKVKYKQVAKLYTRERGSATNIGQNFTMTLEITQNKGGDEVVSTHTLKLPYSLDGIVVNLPGYLAGLPEEAWMSEFVPIATEAEAADEELPAENEFGDSFELGDF